MKESKYKSYEDLPLMLNVQMIADVLGISRSKAYELVSSDGFPSLKLGNRIIVPREQFMEWVREQTGRWFPCNKRTKKVSVGA